MNQSKRVTKIISYFGGSNNIYSPTVLALNEGLLNQNCSSFYHQLLNVIRIIIISTANMSRRKTIRNKCCCL